jgi:predicted nuclease with RNAse H fold
MYVLGFDPGGQKQFGWCVTEISQVEGLNLVDSGTASDSASAITAATKYVTDGNQIASVGIDSPLYWTHEGTRRADALIKSEMKRLGARHGGGTVQHVNSLSGACLVQGILTARLLRVMFPSIRITETHPKALLWLIKIASQDLRAVDVRMSHLVRYISGGTDSVSEHERDAALGAIAAWSMVTHSQGWRDLYLIEEQTFVPVPPVEYWMPIP